MAAASGEGQQASLTKDFVESAKTNPEVVSNGPASDRTGVGDLPYQLTVDDDEFFNLENGGCLLWERFKTPPFDYLYDLKAYRKEQTNLMFQNTQSLVLGSTGKQLHDILKAESMVKDELVHRILRTRFGALDLESSTYKELFTCLKSELLEEYEVFFEKAKDVLGTNGIRVTSDKMKLFESRVKWDEPMGFMSRNDPRRTQSPNVFLSRTEPYDVPRPKSLSFVQRNLVKMKTTVEADKLALDEGFTELKQGRPNLAFFGTGINDLKYISFRGRASFPLIRSILQIVHDYPLGLTPNFLYSEFEKRKKYKIDYGSLEYRSFEDMLKRNCHVFRVLSGKTLSLTYPAFRGEICPVDSQQNKIYHFIVSLLKIWRSEIPVGNVTKYLSDLFGIRLNVQAFGQTSDALYFRVLFTQNGAEEVEVASRGDRSYSESVLRLVMPKEPTPVEILLEEKKLMEKAFASCFKPYMSITPFIPEVDSADFVFQRDSIKRVADALRPGKRYRVLPELMITPAQFFVSLEEKRDMRDDFVIKMTDVYNDWMGKSYLAAKFCLHADHAEPENYTALKFDGEWARGRIVNKSENMFKVFLVDLGMYAKKVKAEELKYLHKRFVSCPELSFLCTLKKDQMERVLGTDAVLSNEFQDDFLKEFYDALSERIIILVPIKLCTQRRQWEVKLLFDELTNQGNVVLHDLARSLLRMQDNCKQIHRRRRRRAREPSTSTDE